ncbi:NUDIX hydrolase [Algicella marina]
MEQSADTPIRDAATLIAWRTGASGPEVLMGQRGDKAAFMPSKFVFPGGRVDMGDAAVTAAPGLPEICTARLAKEAAPGMAGALASAAIRELREETGLLLGRPRRQDDPALGGLEDWAEFASASLYPTAAAMQFVFRAITPPGRPRRFDARFFLVPAAAVCGDPEDFSKSDDELSHLQWVPLQAARALDLPFITGIVLSEVAARLADAAADARPVPFFDNRGQHSRFLML